MYLSDVSKYCSTLKLKNTKYLAQFSKWSRLQQEPNLSQESYSKEQSEPETLVGVSFVFE